MRHWICFNGRLFNSNNNYSVSAALAEVYDLLRAILVIIIIMIIIIIIIIIITRVLLVS